MLTTNMLSCFRFRQKKSPRSRLSWLWITLGLVVPSLVPSHPDLFQRTQYCICIVIIGAGGVPEEGGGYCM